MLWHHDTRDLYSCNSLGSSADRQHSCYYLTLATRCDTQGKAWEPKLAQLPAASTTNWPLLKVIITSVIIKLKPWSAQEEMPNLQSNKLLSLTLSILDGLYFDFNFNNYNLHALITYTGNNLKQRYQTFNRMDLILFFYIFIVYYYFLFCLVKPPSVPALFSGD